MFGRKCSLCGGRLDSKNICTECGLDNTRSDKKYRLNQSECDGQPLTHVHPHPEESDTRKSQIPRRPDSGSARKKQTSAYQPKKKKEKGAKRALAIIPVIVVFAGMLIELISTVGDSVLEWSDSTLGVFSEEENYEYDYDPYAYVARELSEEGEHFRVTLGQGEYVAGVHLPEGTYTVSSSDEYAWVNVSDGENGIYLYEDLSPEENEKEDVRLYAGAKIEVSGESGVTFSTENGQVEDMTSYENPLSGEVYLSGGQAIAGTDFEPGVYDVCADSGYGSVDIVIYDESGEVQLDAYSIWLDADIEGEGEYKNLVLPQGAVISCEEMDLLLTPSETIFSEDYFSYYF